MKKMTRSSEAVQRALDLMKEVREHSPRASEMAQSMLSAEEQRRIWVSVLTRTAGAASTISRHVSAVRRLITSWAAAKGVSAWSINGTQMASFFIEASNGKHSVPQSLYNALKWWHNTLRLQWPIQDEAVLSIASLSAKTCPGTALAGNTLRP